MSSANWGADALVGVVADLVDGMVARATGSSMRRTNARKVFSTGAAAVIVQNGPGYSYADKETPWAGAPVRVYCETKKSGVTWC
ncbi:hypothetical protein ABZY36_34510 [Streptomyces sp. NPDC006627]|uniref:hypothetical protein n=1 Tax=Streptomyces sp. NPDC006627 TaxID=3154679 RepID=UPI0033A80498